MTVSARPMKCTAKKGLASVILALTALFSQAFQVQAQTGAVSFSIRKEAIDNEAVSIVWRYPRIYGLYDKQAQNRLNLFLKEKAEYLAQKVRCGGNQNEKAYFEIFANVTYNDEGLLGFCFETHSNSQETLKDEFITFDVKNGKRLYFWDIFFKDSAKRDEIIRLFESEARQRSEPGTEWVLKEIKTIGNHNFFLDGNKQSLTVIFEKHGRRSLELSIGMSELREYIKPLKDDGSDWINL